MSLDKSSLKSALQAIFDGSADNDHDGHPDGTPTSTTDAGQKLAKAYFDYAGAAMFGSCVPTVTGRDSALATTLGGSLTLPGAAATHAAAWGAGLATFWASVPVAGAGQAGVTAPPAGAAALVTALTTLFSTTGNTASAAAQGLSDALDTCTKTVLATVAPPPGTVLPAT
jgi:hypothetical protein